MLRIDVPFFEIIQGRRLSHELLHSLQEFSCDLQLFPLGSDRCVEEPEEDIQRFCCGKTTLEVTGENHSEHVRNFIQRVTDLTNCLLSFHKGFMHCSGALFKFSQSLPDFEKFGLSLPGLSVEIRYLLFQLHKQWQGRVHQHRLVFLVLWNQLLIRRLSLRVRSHRCIRSLLVRLLVLRQPLVTIYCTDESRPLHVQKIQEALRFLLGFSQSRQFVDHFRIQLLLHCKFLNLRHQFNYFPHSLLRHLYVLVHLECDIRSTFLDFGEDLSHTTRDLFSLLFLSLSTALLLPLLLGTLHLYYQVHLISQVVPTRLPPLAALLPENRHPHRGDAPKKIFPSPRKALGFWQKPRSSMGLDKPEPETSTHCNAENPERHGENCTPTTCHSGNFSQHR
mmetsp:Transcript_55348/g.108337  ORF Transcript_55348/g.108337 Transcript_55348/m.108337 type:complete len:392 (+) Transcript_55348:266-1441(+)